MIDAFDAILKRCRDPELARQLLHIILAAKEPLAVDDMRIATALACDLEYRSYEEIGVERSDVFEMRIKNICGLLVTVDGGSVFLIHQTAKEFLINEDNMSRASGTWKFSFNPLDSEMLIAKICIALLSFTCFSETPLVVENEDADEAAKRVSEYTKDHAFLEYAAINWMEHSKEAKFDDNSKWMTSILSLCSVDSPMFRTWYTIHQRSDKSYLPSKTTSLNLATEFDFPNVLASLLERGEDPNEPDGHGATLLARSVGQSKRAFQLLIQAKADINGQEWLEPWHNEIDDTGSEIEIRPISGTPLVIAALKVDAEMVKHLIDCGATIDFPPYGTMTPLYAALVSYTADSDSKEIIHLLLHRGANVCFEMKDDTHPMVKTALHCAATMIDLSILQALLGSETADVNFQLRELPSETQVEDQDSSESRLGHDEPNISRNTCSLSQDSKSKSSTSECSGNAHSDAHSDADGDNSDDTIISENESCDDNNSRSRSGHYNGRSDSSDSEDRFRFMIGATPLHLAARKGLMDNVRVLLEHGADPHIKNADGYTALDFVLDLQSVGGSSDPEIVASAKKKLIELLEPYDESLSDGKNPVPIVTFSVDG
ncbi:uncharacterized protein N7496_000913 [Penicillium cataractarum]|uniref:GPI inositol-deacylase winged helix domain-containing protein n=1 Tax=Penicillium cataractarum TaxID=2100454 RepID=A0A9W9VVA4_9EURO|nr:uncharacterized protein N7496_000913 [Penicillium cataractarum]KAJ5389845.1 hypothetical protein N7496_000913 [Penicillium cataractarum]